MGRKKIEINPIRGENLKTLITITGLTQQEFADRIGYSKEHLSYIVNGKRNLTDEAAEHIISKLSILPNCSESSVTLEWLLGYTNYKNSAEQFAQIINEVRSETELLHTGLCAFAKLNGYTISFPNFHGKGDISNVLKEIKEGCHICKDGKNLTLSIDELNRFENELNDFVELKLKHLFAERS